MIDLICDDCGAHLLGPHLKVTATDHQPKRHFCNHVCLATWALRQAHVFSGEKRAEAIVAAAREVA